MPRQRRRPARDPGRPIPERIGDAFAPLDGPSTDPDVRRAIARLDALGGIVYDTRTVPASDVQPGAFAWPNDDGSFELVTTVTVWGLDTSCRGHPVPGQTGVVWNGRPTARLEAANPTRPTSTENPPRMVGTYAELDLDECGQVVALRYVFPGLDESDKPHLERAIKAVLDELERRGRPRGTTGTGTWRNHDHFRAVVGRIIRELVRQGKTPTIPTVLAVLAQRDYGEHDGRVMHRWLRDFGYPSWADFVAWVTPSH